MADINNYFQGRVNQYQKSTIHRLWRYNPFRSVIPMEAINLEQGVAPVRRTHTFELPTSYPTALTAVSVSNGTGNPACAPTATTIKRGETQRTFTMYGASFDTDTICLSDIKRAEQAAETASAWEKSLKEYMSVWWSDWYRIQNIAQIDNKATTASSTAISISTSTAANHTGVSAIPTQHLNWDHLIQVYFELCSSGAWAEYAIGTDEKGRPVFPLFAGSGVIRALWNETATNGVREQVKYFDPKSNLNILGIQGAVNGFVPVLDMFPIRYGNATPIAAVAGLTAANMIYPHTNADATVGRKHQKNANYRTTARSGLAQFEVATVLTREAYTALYEPVAPTQFAGMTFNPKTDYVGSFQFINNPTFRGDNDRQNLGYYLADVRVGAEAKNPDLGVSIVTLARD